MSYTYDYPRPAVTVDILLFYEKEDQVKIPLIKRKSDPFKGKWALPGGFIEMDETLEEAALRELKEETNIQAENLVQFRAYDDPDRDPRGRTISVVFYGFLEEFPENNNAGDDAAEIKWFAIQDLPPLAFDHDQVLKDALETVLRVSDGS